MTVPEWTTQYEHIGFDPLWAADALAKYEKTAYQWLSHRSLLTLIFDTPISALTENTDALQTNGSGDAQIATRFAVVYDLAAELGDRLPTTDSSLHDMYKKILYTETFSMMSSFPDFYLIARRLQCGDLRASPQYVVSSSVAPGKMQSQLWSAQTNNQPVVVSVSDVQFTNGTVICESVVRDVLTGGSTSVQPGDVVDIPFTNFSRRLT